MTTGRLNIVDENGVVIATESTEADGYPSRYLKLIIEELKNKTIYDLANDTKDGGCYDYEYILTQKDGRPYINIKSGKYTTEGFIDEIDVDNIKWKHPGDDKLIVNFCVSVDSCNWYGCSESLGEFRNRFNNNKCFRIIGKKILYDGLTHVIEDIEIINSSNITVFLKQVK